MIPADSTHARSCDIFCAVVDNYGDIGVCWRLARQLAAERRWAVRLWVDELTPLARLRPGARVDALRQRLDGVEVAQWVRAPAGTMGHALTVPEIVIEAFGCDLPTAYLEAMAQRQPAPHWINLEYLSAEAWVADFHLRPSPHPRLPLHKTFFFPGLAAGTGGVLHECGLQRARQAFQADPTAPTRVLASLGVPPPAPGTTLVSLFAYENPALDTLLRQWRDGARPVLCLLPEGRLSYAVAAFFGLPDLPAHARASAGNLTVQGVPFTDQPAYDRLLWSCDLNFVRGEDSFVRAQWAARPFVWQIYPQADAAHIPKLEAALALYTAGLAADAAGALSGFWHAWNGAPVTDSKTPAGAGAASAVDWPGLWTHADALRRRAACWPMELSALGDLAGNLASFCENQLK